MQWMDRNKRKLIAKAKATRRDDEDASSVPLDAIPLTLAIWLALVVGFALLERVKIADLSVTPPTADQIYPGMGGGL